MAKCRGGTAFLLVCVFFFLSSVIKFDKICANLTQRSQSLMLFRVLAKVKPLRMGLLFGWGTAEKSP